MISATVLIVAIYLGGFSLLFYSANEDFSLCSNFCFGRAEESQLRHLREDSSSSSSDDDETVAESSSSSSSLSSNIDLEGLWEREYQYHHNYNFMNTSASDIQDQFRIIEDLSGDIDEQRQHQRSESIHTTPPSSQISPIL